MPYDRTILWMALQKPPDAEPFLQQAVQALRFIWKGLCNSWLSKNVENVKTYYADPRCTFLFTVNGYKGLMEAVLFDNQMENIKKVPKNLPLFFVSGADDPVGDLGEGVKKVYGMYKDAGVSDITYRLYEDDRHEILNETDRDQVMADIAAWLNVHVEL